MSAFELYLFTRLDTIIGIAILIAIITGIALMISVCGYAINTNDDGCNSARDAASCKRIALWMAPVFLFSVVVCVTIPTQNHALTIFAGEWATNNEEMKKVPDNAAKALNQYLEEMLHEEETDG